MRNIWIDRHAVPRWADFPKYGITGAFFDILDPRLNNKFLWDARAKIANVGVYAAYSTHPDWVALHAPTGAGHAEKVSARLETIAPGSGKSMPKVQFDWEQPHDPNMILDCFRRWRELRPTRDTSWTLEPFQAGWMSDAFVSGIIDLGIRVVPQYYLGPSPEEPWDMRPAAQDIAMQQLIERGFPRGLISGHYDAKNLPARWDGFAFIQHRLP